MTSFILPSLFTTVRVNTKDHDIDKIHHQLHMFIAKQCADRGLPCLKVHRHQHIHDCLVIPSAVRKNVMPHQTCVVVDYLCGMAVLRGASVFPPGVLCAPGTLKNGSMVSVYADLSGKCLKGSKEYETDQEKMFVGNGISHVSRYDLFGGNKKPDVEFAIEITEPVLHSPALNNVMTDKIFLQNLPSIVASHALAPEADSNVIDMCAAPGGKSTHIYALMRGIGQLTVVDRSRSKLSKIHNNFTNLYSRHANVTIFSGDSCKLREDEHRIGAYDRVLLDAPCSALGQRPRLVSDMVVTDHVKSYPPLQRKLFETAVDLVKVGGVVVYCTCTTTIDENELMVDWALQTFAKLRLVDQQPWHVGGRGRTDDRYKRLTNDDLDKLQYFSMPHAAFTKVVNSQICIGDKNSVGFDAGADLSQACARDTNGFFIAKFIKLS